MTEPAGADRPQHGAPGPAADPGDALWAFSLAVYAMPGVAEACLALQDGHGADVNLLLFAAWNGACGRRLTAAHIAAAEAAAAPWRREVVQPLRAVRRALKVGRGGIAAAEATALRDRVKAAELAAERLEQRALARLAALADAATEAPESAVPGNLRLYLDAIGAGAESALVGPIVAAAGRRGGVPAIPPDPRPRPGGSLLARGRSRA